MSENNASKPKIKMPPTVYIKWKSEAFKKIKADNPSVEKERLNEIVA